eukprot:5749083-Pleurochrysis_carterae.AAC.1
MAPHCEHGCGADGDSDRRDQCISQLALSPHDPRVLSGADSDAAWPRSERHPKVLRRLADAHCAWSKHLGGGLPREAAPALPHQEVASLERGVMQAARQDGSDCRQELANDAAKVQSM